MTAGWMNLGQQFKLNAKKYPDKVSLKDSRRRYTYPETNRRVNQLAHGLFSLGLSKGDKVAVLLENSIEIVEVFLATAKTGLVIVPINFRLAAGDIEYIVNNSDAKAMIVHDAFTETVDAIKDQLGNISPEHFFVVGEDRSGYRPYESFIESFGRHEAGRYLDFDLHLRDHRQAEGGGALPCFPYRFLSHQCRRFWLQRARRLPERHAAVPHQFHLFHLHLHLSRCYGLYPPGDFL